jgi:hypothetical protein
MTIDEEKEVLTLTNRAYAAIDAVVDIVNKSQAARILHECKFYIVSDHSSDKKKSV